MRVAAFDVGTNTLLCLVADIGAGSLRVIRDDGEITGLGRGASADGSLASEPLERARAALGRLARQARSLGATRLVGVGTSALREAPNRDEFVVFARQTLDLFEVIEGEREAELTLAGALPGLRLASPDFTVVDIGGGSTEIAHAKGARVSLPLGSIRLLERHLHSDPPGPDEVRALCREVDESRAAAAAHRSPTLVALAGTALGVASVATLDHYDPSEAHGQRLSRAQLREIAERLSRLPLLERACVPGIPKGREDVLVAGAWLLSRIAEASGAAQIITSTGGVRYGLAATL